MFELCDRLFGIYKVKNCTSATYIAPELLELEEKKKKTSTKANTNQSVQNAPDQIESNENINPEENEKTMDTTIVPISNETNETQIN